MSILPLSAATPPDLELVASAADAPLGFKDAAGRGLCDAVCLEEESSPGGVSSMYEQNAVAALLGLHSAWPSTNSSHDEDSRDDEATATGAEGSSGSRWGERVSSWPMLSGMGDVSPGDASPKAFRPIDYETPGPPSPKRMRAPKDGALRLAAWPHISGFGQGGRGGSWGARQGGPADSPAARLAAGSPLTLLAPRVLFVRRGTATGNESLPLPLPWLQEALCLH